MTKSSNPLASSAKQPFDLPRVEDYESHAEVEMCRKNERGPFWSGSGAGC